MSFAENLSPQVRKKAENNAILSTFFGCVSEKLFGTTAVIVIYLSLMGADESFNMFFTAISSIAGVIFLIPCAALTAKFGLRKAYTFTCLTGCCAFLGMACAAFAGSYGKYIMIFCGFTYAMTQDIYSSCWYPMLDNFLLPGDRSRFFGKMRFSYTLFNAVLLYCLGKLMGTQPPVWLMQIIFVCGGLGLLGRKFEMDRMPVDPHARRETVNIALALRFCFRNSSLIGFAFYTCLVTLAYSTAVTLGVIYMKSSLNMGAETLMNYSALSLAGLIIGFGIVGKVIKRFKIKVCQVGTHLAGLFVCILLLISVPQNPLLKVILAGVFLFSGITSAFISCINSTEMMALSKPGNKVMTTAFFSTSSLIGAAVGRLVTTFILGCGALAPEWELWGMKMTKYQFLFGMFTIMLAFFLLFLPLIPSLVPRHKDYYNP